MVSIYIKVFLITIVMFLIGLGLGISLENFMTSDISSQTYSIESSIKEMELEMLYFQSLDESYSCEFLSEITRRVNNELDTLAGQITGYSEEDIIFEKDIVKKLKEKYVFLLLKGWMLQEIIKEDCGEETVTVLYFYSKECDDCLIQGNILTLFKDRLKENIMIFPLDVDTDSLMLDVLKKRFDIDSTPSLVIDEKKYNEIITKEQLKNIICDKLENTNCMEI